ncbi:FecCD family ABC transporter permease [Yinghuangia soli]|uniref:Iron chelate uptake ABC transporter family permease subunit n=1 Tax=Yinghuangia soli TaxID=2908204 RepID=A0AA41PVF7_9ACTN|nr:iron chelate uptake ABC transporter family permease subunit [Yinghuangia soli]MCF2526585.1 iron chelate uptake ABC transporter family permease subunit [Yinghuangia soli]
MASLTRETGGKAPAAPRHHVARRGLGLLLAAVALGVLCLASIWVGTRGIAFTEVWGLLWHDDGSKDALVVHEYRIPRTVLGLVVGAAVGLAGALMQAVTRNPLADPGLLGVSLGASTGVITASAFAGVVSVLGQVWFAFAGAAIASAAVFLLGSAGRTRATPERLVIAGAAVTAVLYAFNSAVLLLQPRIFNEFRFWQVGSLAGRQFDVVAVVAPFVGVGALIAIALARPLNGLALGDEAARGIGVRVGPTRLAAALAVVLLCGAATAGAGPIAFVGLAVPHIARFIAGPDQRWVLAYSAVLAPILLLGADVLGRVLGSPGEIQSGIVTALLGGPVFLALCRRRKLVML